MTEVGTPYRCWTHLSGRCSACPTPLSSRQIQRCRRRNKKHTPIYKKIPPTESTTAARTEPRVEEDLQERSLHTGVKAAACRLQNQRALFFSEEMTDDSICTLRKYCYSTTKPVQRCRAINSFFVFYSVSLLEVSANARCSGFDIGNE